MANQYLDGYTILATFFLVTAALNLYINSITIFNRIKERAYRLDLQWYQMNNVHSSVKVQTLK